MIIAGIFIAAIIVIMVGFVGLGGAIIAAVINHFYDDS